MTKNIKVVAVEMNWMRERRVAGVGLDYPVLPLRTMRHSLDSRFWGCGTYRIGTRDRDNIVARGI